MGTRDERLHCVAAALLPLVGLVAATPFGAQPVNDDWQMYWSAFHFAATGDARIPDYSAMGMVGWTVPAGALVSLFGAGFVALRLVTMATLAFSGWAAYRLAREFEVGPPAALAVSATVTFCPVLFWLSTSFMTDAPWHALWIASLWLLARGLRTGRTLDFALGAIAAAWAAWIRIPAAAIPLSLVGAVLVARVDPSIRRRAVVAAVVTLVVGAGAFWCWYTFVHGATVAYRTKSGVDVARMARALPGGVFATVAYAGFFLLPLAPFALARERGGRKGPAVAAGLFAALALVQAKTGFLGTIHKSMPYLPNVAFNLGLGPLTLTNVYREGGAPPVTVPGIVQVGLGVALAALGGALVWIALRRVADALRARSDARVGFVAAAVVLYAGAAILFTKDNAPLFDRYLVPMVAPIAFLLLAPLGAGEELPPSRTGAFACGGLLVATAAFAVLGTRDYHRFTEARFSLADQALAKGASARHVDGGFEFNCWHYYDAASRGEFTPAAGWKGWLVEDPEFVVATRERAGYDVIDRRGLLSLVGAKRWDLLLLRRGP